MGKRQNILLKLILISEIFMLLNIDVVNPTLKVIMYNVYNSK